MDRKPQLFIAAVVASGVIALGVALSQWQCANPLGFIVFLTLALIGSSFKLRIRGMEGTYSANFVFVLIGIGVLTRTETMLLACAGAVAQTLWRTARRPTVVQVGFNIANLSLSALIAYSVPRILMSRLESANPLMLVALAACLYFVVNTVLVSGVISRLSGDAFGVVWKRWHLWSFPYYLGGAAIAAIAILATPHADWRWFPLMLPPIYLIYRYCLIRT
jgi:hypothetical protein